MEGCTAGLAQLLGQVAQGERRVCAVTPSCPGLQRHTVLPPAQPLAVGRALCVGTPCHTAVVPAANRCCKTKQALSWCCNGLVGGTRLLVLQAEPGHGLCCGVLRHPGCCNAFH